MTRVGHSGALIFVAIMGLLILLVSVAQTTMPVHDHAAMQAAEAGGGQAGGVQAGGSAPQPTGFWQKIMEVYVPRRMCMNYEADVIWLHVISDTVVALAYYSIPIALIYFVRRRRDITFHWIFVAFAAFILACGTTHVFSIIAIWHPLYRLDGIVKAITALLSILTAVVLWPLIPKALAIPSPATLRAANEELRAAHESAERASHSKSRFLANMSHEIRTPMTSIIGYADLIMEPDLSPSDRLEYISTIRKNGEHLLQLINGILDLSKIEAGKFMINKAECSPCLILAEVTSLMRARAGQKNIELIVENRGPVPTLVQTDGGCLKQILINLIGNAIKFTDKGEVRVTLRLDKNAAGIDLLRFDIVDTGIGLNDRQMGRLFESFSQADDSDSRRFDGTGLGLAISKRLVEMLGGEIDVKSVPGKGSSFSFTLDPGSLAGVQRITNWRELLPAAAPESAGPPAAQLCGRVLLCEDGEHIRQLLVMYMKEAGLEVTVAENGRIGYEKALAAMRDGAEFTVIIMDMQMPEMDGYAATSNLRSKGYKGPIIALTAHAMTEDRAKCLGAGCTDYLSKPVRRGDFLAMVERYTRMGS
ncbi:MAG TPA: ATP-binding protein [Phycisphaerae bacterium]|jgi:signal transduction histidine kinase/ActR/RegA family two-component response regulator